MNKNNIKIPFFASRFLKGILPERIETTAIGDYEEIYANLFENKGKIKAHLWLWSQIYRALPDYLFDLLRRNINMIKNYLKIAFRNMMKNRTFSIINIAGLAVGISCFLLMLLWVNFELSFDKFHDNKDSIYRVIFEKKIVNRISIQARGSNATGPALLEEYPEVVNFTRFRGDVSGWLITYGETRFVNDRLAVADPSFFDVFTFPFISGDPKTALQDRYSIVISESMAEKYFEGEEPLGKQIKIESQKFTITGVMKDIPPSSQIQFDYVFPIINMEKWWGDPSDSWTRDFRFHTYIQLTKNTDWLSLNDKIPGFVREHYPESTTQRIFLQPLLEAHLHSSFARDIGGQGSILNVYVFFLTALGVLLIACINFMNLSTARSSLRAKEIGIRKVSGAKRKNIIIQFIGESILISMVSLILAVLIIKIFLPLFNELTNKPLVFDLLGNFELSLVLLGIALITGLLAGFYPALYLSAFRPVKILKGITALNSERKLTLRRILVTIQLSFTIFLIIASIIIYKQLDYVYNKPLGWDMNNVLSFDSIENIQTFKNELLKNPNVLSFTNSCDPADAWSGTMTDVDWEGKNPSQIIRLQIIFVDYDYLDTFGIQMADGRYFLEENTTDKNNYIINETAAKMMGLDSPVGKSFTYGGQYAGEVQTGTIVGVIKDFHNGSLHYPINPHVFKLTDSWFSIAAKISHENTAETLRFIRQKWDEVNPERPISYEFLDEKVHLYYEDEAKIAKICMMVSFLAIFISCLGIMGLTACAADQRSKEIGIRKVLGASVTTIMKLLTNEIVILTIVSCVFAWPTAWYLMSRWLDNFAYRTNTEVELFLISAVLVLGTSLVTVSYLTFKAASSNPVNTLRYE